jgi:hypothetical protein
LKSVLVLRALVVSALLPIARLGAQDTTYRAPQRPPHFFITSVTGAPDRLIGPESITVLRHRITVDLSSVSLRDALESIAKQADLSLAFSPTILHLDATVSLTARSTSVGNALTDVLANQGLDVIITPRGQLMLRRKPPEVTGSVTGLVTESGQGAVMGSTQIVIIGTQLVGSTNESGRYLITGVPSGVWKVRATHAAYQPSIQTVEVPAKGSVALDFSLRATADDARGTMPLAPHPGP